MPNRGLYEFQTVAVGTPNNLTALLTHNNIPVSKLGETIIEEGWYDQKSMTFRLTVNTWLGHKFWLLSLTV